MTMKKLILTLFILGLCSIHSKTLDAQFFDYIKKKADKAADKTTEEAVETGTEETVKSIFGNKNESGKEEEPKSSAKEKSGETTEDETKPSLNWAKFDFVPGDQVIFEDAPSQDEENGEFPSRWDLKKGNVEIAEADGQKVIMFRDGRPEIIPYLKNANKDYLPEIFTIEFDYYRPPDGSRIYVYLYDRKNQKRQKKETHISIGHQDIQCGAFSSKYPKKIDRKKGKWTHVSIAYTKGKLKAYFDDVRLINIPRLDFDPKGFTLQCYGARNDKLFYVKNVRIAKGGVKYYDRFLSEGKIVVNGIRFDVGKATLRPESMGPINRIYKLLKKHADVRFSVEGHTDSDGQTVSNKTLSKARAKAVVDKLVEMGIDKRRLKHKGWGENKPIDTNGTPEGKANNRRVEFVKI